MPENIFPVPVLRSVRGYEYPPATELLQEGGTEKQNQK